MSQSVEGSRLMCLVTEWGCVPFHTCTPRPASLLRLNQLTLSLFIKITSTDVTYPQLSIWTQSYIECTSFIFPGELRGQYDRHAEADGRPSLFSPDQLLWHNKEWCGGEYILCVSSRWYTSGYFLMHTCGLVASCSLFSRNPKLDMISVENVFPPQ